MRLTRRTYRRRRAVPRIAPRCPDRVAAYSAGVRRFLGSDGASSGADKPPADVRGGPRRRDRHGRGIRTRPERFDDLVLDSVERVEQVVKDDIPLAAKFSLVEYGVEEVPPEPVIAATEGGSDPLPLGRAEEATASSPPRVVVYRRPIELRAPDLRDREAIVHEIVVDRLAELLGVPVDQLDPPPPD
jgi:Zincin-like metallopeptidase